MAKRVSKKKVAVQTKDAGDKVAESAAKGVMDSGYKTVLVENREAIEERPTALLLYGSALENFERYVKERSLAFNGRVLVSRWEGQQGPSALVTVMDATEENKKGFCNALAQANLPIGVVFNVAKTEGQDLRVETCKGGIRISGFRSATKGFHRFWLILDLGVTRPGYGWGSDCRIMDGSITLRVFDRGKVETKGERMSEKDLESEEYAEFRGFLNELLERALSFGRKWFDKERGRRADRAAGQL